MAWSEMEIARILIDRQVSRQIHFGPRSQESPTFRQSLILSNTFLEIRGWHIETDIFGRNGCKVYSSTRITRKYLGPVLSAPS